MFSVSRFALIPALLGVLLVMPTAVEARTHAQHPDASVVALSIDGTGHYFLDGKRVSEGQLEPLLAARVHKHPHLTARIRADKEATYGQVEHLIDLVKQSGIRSVSLAVPTSPRKTASP